MTQTEETISANYMLKHQVIQWKYHSINYLNSILGWKKLIIIPTSFNCNKVLGLPSNIKKITSALRFPEDKPYTFIYRTLASTDYSFIEHSSKIFNTEFSAVYAGELSC
jgi:hypothetical protein